MPSSISASLSSARFDAFAGLLARELDADLVLSASGYPAQTTSMAGVRPVEELLVTKATTPDEIKRFAFAPGVCAGFLSYTYGMLLRGIETDKPSSFPLGHLKRYAAIAEYDPATGQAHIQCGDSDLLKRMTALLDSAQERLPDTVVRGLPEGTPRVSLDQEAYENGVRETLARIRAGYTYQLNLSTRFAWECPDLDPLSLFLSLRNNHPAPFYAWLRSGPFSVLSTSPERFLRVQDGQVLSQPIKGTLRFDQYTPALEARLTQSPKEDAELSMIVDLIRNDISRNCTYGSVQVKNHKAVFAVDNLLQMYADVHGTLRENRDCLDLFLDAFPGGSITGCPKKSSMEIIESLEPHSRDIYCGSVVVIRDERNMDSSIAIRTAVHDADRKELKYWAGSGIVVDSNPASEYQETMAKAEKFLILGE